MCEVEGRSVEISSIIAEAAVQIGGKGERTRLRSEMVSIKARRFSPFPTLMLWVLS
ncbi:MAG: hypothetical protein H8D56_10520 [Planctomycetes bacterium]|nr:hypothetical protein [Planctomycetota bacterium]MBL7144158.1 hypothetical protein [Phycisphaerae bacterium]